MIPTLDPAAITGRLPNGLSAFAPASAGAFSLM